MERDYTIAALKKGLQVAEFLAGGDIMAWKTAKEVAAAVGISQNEAQRILWTLAGQGWAEKSEKGYRQDSKGLVRHAVYAQEYLHTQATKLVGIRSLL